MPDLFDSVMGPNKQNLKAINKKIWHDDHLSLQLYKTVLNFGGQGKSRVGVGVYMQADLAKKIKTAPKNAKCIKDDVFLNCNEVVKVEKKIKTFEYRILIEPEY